MNFSILYSFWRPVHLILFSDMDVVFALAYLENVSPVTVSLRKDVPPAGSPEAERILGLQAGSISNSDEVLPTEGTKL